jgi:hypothetical protein
VRPRGLPFFSPAGASSAGRSSGKSVMGEAALVLVAGAVAGRAAGGSTPVRASRCTGRFALPELDLSLDATIGEERPSKLPVPVRCWAGQRGCPPRAGARRDLRM